jgi:hypothetical protein
MATKTRSDDESATTAMPTGSVGDAEPKGLKDAASGVADEAGRTLQTTAARSMSQVGDTLHQVADAVRQSSETLQTEQPQVGRFITTAADKLDEAATFLSDREPTQLLDDAQQLARRQPGVVIAGGLIAGLLIGRALRSAGGQPSARGTDSHDWYSAGYPGSSGSRSGVSSGYGTGYGASYDQATSGGARRGDGSGHLTGVMASGGSDLAEG